MDELKQRFELSRVIVGRDARADVCLFEVQADRVPELLRLRLAEDVFVEIGRTLRAEGDRPRWIANRIWKRGRVERALAFLRAVGRSDHSVTTFRVVARVQSERAFRRTDLRREFVATVERDRADWIPADPAAVEFWVIEYSPGRFVAGLRLSTAAMRQRAGRAIERHGALRPAAAAAMVRLAGAGETLLDPCCGSGTVLREAIEVGWTAYGCDIDPDAVATARRNASGAEIVRADVRSLPFADGAFDACVTNPPFGRQFEVEEPLGAWLEKAVGEMARVTDAAGSIVLLTPLLPLPSLPAGLDVHRRLAVDLLGMPTTIWVLRHPRE